MRVKVKSYGTRTDQSMQTWIALSRTFYQMSTKEIEYFKSYNLTLHQFKVLEVLYHRGSLSVGAVTKLTMSTSGNMTVVVRNLRRDKWIDVLSNPNDKRSRKLCITPIVKIDRVIP